MNRALKILLVIVCVPIVLIVMLILYTWVDIQAHRLWFHTKSTDPVVGNLGGVPVAIPRPFAHFVEYDADPHFMERKGWSAPERTFQSNLRSFGFEVRYPDMASVEVQTKAEKDVFTTLWMRVGVSTGEDYGVDESLENHKSYYLNSKFTCISRNHCYIYEPLPEKTHGLTGYTPIGSGVDV